MAPPGPRTITRLRFIPNNAVEVSFSLSGPAAILNSIQYTQSGAGWDPALIMNVGGTVRLVNAVIPSSGLGKEWAFRVRGVNQDGNGPYSSIERIYVPTVPARVALPTLNLTRPISISVSWAAPSSPGASITAYQVRYSPNSNMSGAKILDTTNRSVVITDAPIGVTTYFQVRARNVQGWGEWSLSATIVIDGGPRIRTGTNVWKHTVAYVRYNGSWRRAIPYVKQNNVWKPGIG